MKQDPEPQLVGCLQPTKGPKYVRRFNIVDAGYSQAVGLGLGCAHRLQQAIRIRGWQDRADQLLGPLHEDAGRFARSISDDAASLRIGAVARDTRDPQRVRVDPRGVDVDGLKKCRLTGDRVQNPAVRQSLPAIGVPTMPSNPSRLRQPPSNPLERLGATRRPPELNPTPILGPEAKVGMTINEAWRDECIRQIEAGHPSRHLPLQLTRVADRPDGPVLPPNRVSDLPSVKTEDSSSAEQAAMCVIGGRRHA